MDELQERIAACCKKLRLSSRLAEQAMIPTGESNPEFLLGLLTREIMYRRDARITKYLNTAGFPKRYTREQFRTDEIDFPEGVTLDSLLDLDFYHSGKNVIMYGMTGAGKTMLSILIGPVACKITWRYEEIFRGLLTKASATGHNTDTED